MSWYYVLPSHSQLLGPTPANLLIRTGVGPAGYFCRTFQHKRAEAKARNASWMSARFSSRIRRWRHLFNEATSSFRNPPPSAKLATCSGFAWPTWARCGGDADLGEFLLHHNCYFVGACRCASPTPNLIERRRLRNSPTRSAGESISDFVVAEF